MRTSQELRWQQNIKDNGERRRRYADISKQIDAQQREHVREKAQKALELRRQERARLDELMRNPAQQPAPPTKPILRKGMGTVLRTQNTPKRDVWSIAAVAENKPRSEGKLAHERQRREWREGLKQYIARQRETARGSTEKATAETAILSWQELKMAAEAGFEELLKNQEAAARQQQPCGQEHQRQPALARSNQRVPGNAAGVSFSPSMPANHARSDVSSDQKEPYLASKWVVRMNRIPTAAMQDKPVMTAIDNLAVVQTSGWGIKPPTADICLQHALSAAEGTAKTCQQLCDTQQMRAAAATSKLEASSAALWGNSSKVDAIALITEGVTKDASPCFCSADSNPVDISQSDTDADILSELATDQQHMPAAAQLAADALRSSMDQLHRATEIMRHSAHFPLAASPPAVGERPGSASLLHASAQGTHAVQLQEVGQWSESENPQPEALPAAEASSVEAACLNLDNACTYLTGYSSSNERQPSQPQTVSSRMGCVKSDVHVDYVTAAITVPTSRLSPAGSSLTMPQPSLQQEPLTTVTQQSEVIDDQPATALLQQLTGTPSSSVSPSPGGQPLPTSQWGPPLPLISQDQKTVAGQLCTLDTVPAAMEEPGRFNPTTSRRQQQQLLNHSCDCTKDPHSGDCSNSACPSGHNVSPAVAQPAAELAEGPSLDSLLMEVQQLAALRQALKAELAALGHDDLVAAMGTLRLSASTQVHSYHMELQENETKSAAVTASSQPCTQLQPGGPVQQAEVEGQIGQRVLHSELAQPLTAEAVHPQTAGAMCAQAQQQTTSQHTPVPLTADPVHSMASRPQAGSSTAFLLSQTDLSTSFGFKPLQEDHADAAAESKHVGAEQSILAGNTAEIKQQQLPPSEPQELRSQWKGFSQQLQQPQTVIEPVSATDDDASATRAAALWSVQPAVQAIVDQGLSQQCAYTQHCSFPVATPFSIATAAPAPAGKVTQHLKAYSNQNTNSLCLNPCYQTAGVSHEGITAVGGRQNLVDTDPDVFILPVGSGIVGGSMTGSASPIGSAVCERFCGTSLGKHAKQAQQGCSGGKQPAAADRRSSNDFVSAAERPLVNQGSYLAAALAAKKRAEQVEVKRQQLKATAAAVASKDAAARKLQAQHEEALKASKHLVMAVEMSSYTQQAKAQFVQQTPEAAPGRSDNSNHSNNRPYRPHLQQLEQQLQSEDAVDIAVVQSAANNAAELHPAGHKGASWAKLPALHSTTQNRQMGMPSCTGAVANHVPRSISTSSSQKPHTGVSAAASTAASSRAMSSSVTPTPSRIPSAPGTPKVPTQVTAGLQIPAKVTGDGALGAVGQPICGSMLGSCGSDLDHLERGVDGCIAEEHSSIQQHPGRADTVHRDVVTITKLHQHTTRDTNAHVAEPEWLSYHTDGAAQSELYQHNMWAAVQAAAAAASSRTTTCTAAAALIPKHGHGVGACNDATTVVKQAGTPSADQGCIKRPAQPVISNAKASQRSSKKEVCKVPGAYSRPRASQMPSAAAATSAKHNRHTQQCSPEAALHSPRQLADVYKDVQDADHERHTAPATALPQPAQSCTATSRGKVPTVTRLPAGQPAARAASNNLNMTLDQQRLQASLDALDVRLAAIKANRSTNSEGEKQPASRVALTPGTTATALASSSIAVASANRARPTTKMPPAMSSKAKEQRDSRPAGTRGAVSPKVKASLSQLPAAELKTAVGPWFGQGPAVAPGCLPLHCLPPVPVHMAIAHSDCMSAVGRDTSTYRHVMLPHNPGHQAAAAWTAAAPAHLPVPRHLMQAPYAQEAMAVAEAVPITGMGMANYPAGALHWQQQQYFAALQAQQYQRWQNSNGWSHPNSAGSISMFADFHRPSAICVQPPNSAPVSGQFPPGSPLLPTLHYQQTVMRNRSSSSGSGAVLAGSSKEQVLGGMQHGSIRAGGADVWPSRGVNSSCMSVGARSLQHAGQQPSGSIKVYKAGLLS